MKKRILLALSAVFLFLSSVFAATAIWSTHVYGNFGIEDADVNVGDWIKSGPLYLYVMDNGEWKVFETLDDVNYFFPVIDIKPTGNFDGWYFDPNSSNKLPEYGNSGHQVIPSDNPKLYAKFK